jgi:hypothetical protein
VTSLRRTPEGNALVGGVPNSGHLKGDRIDVVGTTPAQLKAYYGPNSEWGWHKNHWHGRVPGANFPYFGKRGTKGLR